MCIDLKELFGIKDVADDVKATMKQIRNTLRSDTGKTHTFTVQKAYCCPIEPLIQQALETYGVKIVAMSKSKVVSISMLEAFKLNRATKLDPERANIQLPLATQCTVTVRQSQAEWAEYLLERTKRLYVVGGRINAKNRDWASRHDGRMPRPWIEKDCNEGNTLWSQANKKGQSSNGK